MNYLLTPQQIHSVSISKYASFVTPRLVLLIGLTTTILSYSQTTNGTDVTLNAKTPRVITSSTGETITVKLIGKTADSLDVLRISDSKRIKIPFDRLSDMDRALVAKWDPTPIQDYKPSSVTMAPNGSSSGLGFGMGKTFLIPRQVRTARPTPSSSSPTVTIVGEPQIVSTRTTTTTYMVKGKCCNNQAPCQTKK